MNTALVMIDIQNDYFPAGTNALEGSLQAVDQASRLLEWFREAGLPRFHVQHLSTRPGAGFFLSGTPGAEIHSSVQPAAEESVIVKHFPNSFRETSLLRALEALEIKRLVVAGMMTHMCVDATVRAAVDLGFDVYVAADACATKALRFGGETVPARHVHAAFLAALSGVYAEVAMVDDLLRKLQTEQSPAD